MPMPYPQPGLLEAVAKHHSAKEAKVSPVGSPDFLKITREIARSASSKTSNNEIAITGS
jgi:hypothetical protein